MAQFSHSRKWVASCGTVLVAMFVTGCGIGTLAPSGEIATSTQAVIQGRTIGGQQPVIGATVGLYRVGNAGYGKGFTE